MLPTSKLNKFLKNIHKYYELEDLNSKFVHRE